MSRPGRAQLALLGALPLSAALPIAPAAADAQIGGWFGPRFFSSDSKLGYIPLQDYPGLASSISLGPRIGYAVLPWLVPELELAFSPSQTETMSLVEKPVRVYWLDPRLHLRFELLPGRRLQPFVVAGGGAPIALSTKRTTFDSGIIGSGYLGGGVRFDTQKGFVLRFDLRIAFLPGIERVIAPEVDVGFGVELTLGKRRPRASGEGGGPRGGRPGDRDEDDIADEKDGCPDRAEDADGFDDGDGCPDIDNDLDRVLDIADRCASVPEQYNGFQDDDGCPDALPPEVDNLKGTIEGLLYAEGETRVREAAQPSIERIAKTMTAHPSIRVVLIGHTDDREAKQFAPEIELTGEGGDGKDGAPAAPPPPPDVAALSADLSRARAEAVKQAITALGIAGPRIDVEGHGAEEPVSENDKPRGRLANRRVEIKLYVPPSSGVAK